MKFQLFLGFLLVLALAVESTEAEDEFAETGAVIAVFKELGITEDVVAKHQAMGEKIYKPKNLAELIALGKKYGATPEDLKKAPEIAKRFGIPEN